MNDFAPVNEDLVTIGAFNYNNGKFVIEALNSIKQQDYLQIELIVIDDCSNDNSVLLINEWLKSYKKPYKFIIHEVNRGLVYGIDEAIKVASGKYFSILATDDIMLQNKISSQVATFKNLSKDFGLVYGDCMLIDEDGVVIEDSLFDAYLGKDFVPPSGDIFAKVVKDFIFYIQASLINLDKFKKINFKFDKIIISEDWDMELAISRNYKIDGSRDICVKYRKVNTSVTSLNWVDDKMHKIHISHLFTFKRYVNHPLNSVQDNMLLLAKIKFIYWNKIYPSKNVPSNEKKRIYYSVCQVSKSINDYIILMLMHLNLFKIYQKIKEIIFN